MELNNIVINQDENILKLYKITSEDFKVYYGITKLPINMTKNLFHSYMKHKPNDKKEYYDILDKNSVACVLEKFNDREQAKKRLHELIKSDPNCVNIIKEKKPKVEQDKIIIPKKEIIPKKTKKTEDPNYLKNYYETNKSKLKQYYQTNKEKIKNYNKTKYQQLKEKLNKLAELEGGQIN